MNDPQQLAQLVGEFGRAYTRWLMSQTSGVGTSPSRARLLMGLQCQGECKMSQIGVWLGVTPRNITKLVDGLEGEGLVTRIAHPIDRRSTLLRITDKGRLVCKESALANHAAAANLYEQLSASDRKDFGRILKKLLAALEKQGERGA